MIGHLFDVIAGHPIYKFLVFFQGDEVRIKVIAVIRPQAIQPVPVLLQALDAALQFGSLYLFEGLLLVHHFL